MKLVLPSTYINMGKSFGKTYIRTAKPDFTFPFALMSSLFVVGYGMEYVALAQYHVAHDNAEIEAAKECYKKHGGGGH